MVRKSLGISSATRLDGKVVCVQRGTTWMANTYDYFVNQRMRLREVHVDSAAESAQVYGSGGCDVVAMDRSQLASIRSTFPDSADHVILPEAISKEPLSPVVPHGDDQWFDLVKLVMFGLINAEELGVTSANVDQVRALSTDVRARVLVGVEGDWGHSVVGLDREFMVRVLKAVGNYGGIYDRHMGPQSQAFTLARGLNRLWTEGGLMYAPPLSRGNTPFIPSAPLAR